MNPRKRIRVGQIVQVSFAALVVVFIAIYLSRVDWHSLEHLTLNWGWLILATLIALAFRYWGAGIWLYLLERLGAVGVRNSWVELSYVYAKAWLGRYLLGAGTWILGKVYFASQHGISKAKLAVSGLLEGALQLIATLIVGIGLLLVDPRLGALGSGAAVVSIVALICGVVALVPVIFRFGVRLVYRVVRRRTIPAEDLPDGPTIITGGLLYLIGTLITGVSYFFIAQAVYAELDWGDLLYIVGASSVAAAVSLLAVFAPGGIGVREGVQVLFFSALMPVEAAVVVSVLMRVWSLVVDGLFFGATLGVRGLVRHNDRRKLQR